MTETIPIRVQHKRMSASDWASSTLVLLDGELGVESDTGKVKVGNGRDRFSALQYLTGPKGDRGETGPVGPKGADGVVRFENLTSQQRESLRGPQGVQGERGRDGLDGEVSFNLLNGTKEFKRDLFGAPENWQRDLIWNVEPDKYKDFTVLSTINNSNGLWQNIEVEQGKMYEFGFYAKANVAHNNANIGVSWGASTAKTPRVDGNPSGVGVQLTTDWKLYTFRFTAEKNGWTQTRFEQTGGVANRKLFLCGLYFKEVKNNKTEPLGWSPSLDDLRGPAGPTGPAGANGATGPAGPRGADGAPGQNIINQNDGQALKYWAGTRSQYDAISNKDANTIYDIYR